MRRITRLFLERLDDHPLHLIVTDDRGFLGRGSSCNPSTLRRANRPRHFPTVSVLQPNRAAIAVLESPSAAANTIRQRNADACALFGRRAQRSNTSRSSSFGTTRASGGITPSIVVDHDDEFTTKPTCPRTNDSGG
jgi:hypothetical protein